jgi:glycosyltransferase involved in cell wall biosynthesis
MAKVGVIIPTHNRADLLRKAIQSVLRQTEPNLDVFVIDDGSSSDAAERIVHGCQDDRLTFIRFDKSRGAAAARNVGIQRVTASYVAFLDDDDEWLPDKLKVQIAVMEESPADVAGVFTARVTVDRATGREWTTRSHGKFDPWAPNTITTSSMLVRRTCLDIVGGFDETLEAIHDFDMWVRLSALFRFTYIDRPLVRYLVHDAGLTSDYTKKARSADRLIEKHRALFMMDRRSYSRRHVWLGTLYARAGKVREARRSFLTAVRVWPFHPAAYLNLGLISLGGDMFRRVWKARAR